MPSRNITLDLDIFSSRDLSALAAWLQEHVCILHCGWHDEKLFQLSMEANNDDDRSDNLDDAAVIAAGLNSLIAAIELLPDELRPQWETAKAIDFNISVETGDCQRHHTKIDAAILQRIAALNGALNITTYPAE